MILKNKNELINIYIQTNYDAFSVKDINNNDIDFLKENIDDNFYKIFFKVNYDTYVFVNYPKPIIIKIGNPKLKFFYFTTKDTKIEATFYKDNKIVKDVILKPTNVEYYFNEYYTYYYEDITFVYDYVKLEYNNKEYYFSYDDIYKEIQNNEIKISDNNIVNIDEVDNNQIDVYDYNQDKLKDSNCIIVYKIDYVEDIKTDIDDDEYDYNLLVLDLKNFYISIQDILEDITKILDCNNLPYPINPLDINKIDKHKFDSEFLLKKYFKQDDIDFLNLLYDLEKKYNDAYCSDKLNIINNNKDKYKIYYKTEFLKYIPINFDISKFFKVDNLCILCIEDLKKIYEKFNFLKTI